MLRSIGVDAALQLERGQYECTTHSFACVKCLKLLGLEAKIMRDTRMKTRTNDINIIEAYRNGDAHAAIPCNCRKLRTLLAAGGFQLNNIS